MIVHDVSWEIDATREEIWSIFHPAKDFDPAETSFFKPRVLQHRNVRIEIINEGNSNGQGLVCHALVCRRQGAKLGNDHGIPSA